MALLQLTKRSSSSLKLKFFLCLQVLDLHFRATSTVIKIPPGYSVPAVFVFGDSIMDTGNNNNLLMSSTKSNFPPYGKDFIDGRATGRFSNGRVPSDLVASGLGIKELLPPYADTNLQPEDLITGVCFASAGSGFDPLSSKLLQAIPLADQLSMFKEYSKKLEGLVGEETAKFIIANSLYLVVAGSNDLDFSYYLTRIRRVQYDIESYTDFMIESASSFVKELYAAGGRRMGFFGVPPLGCVPTQRTLGGGIERGCVDEYNSAAKMYNGKLHTALDGLQTLLPNSKVVYVDVYNPLHDIILNPTKYGFEVVDKGCCATGTIEVSVFCNEFDKTCPNATKYVFWDSFHPTEATYKFIVDSLLQKYISSFF